MLSHNKCCFLHSTATVPAPHTSTNGCQAAYSSVLLEDKDPLSVRWVSGKASQAHFALYTVRSADPAIHTVTHTGIISAAVKAARNDGPLYTATCLWAEVNTRAMHTHTHHTRHRAFATLQLSLHSTSMPCAVVNCTVGSQAAHTTVGM